MKLRNQKSVMKRYTLQDFHKQFPNEDACLEWLKNHLYPNGVFCRNCQAITKHHKVTGRRSYACQDCGRQMFPTANTIYHKSTTPLTLWFYATYLMSATRCGIAAKQLERELGVTYKCAWRMFYLIRTLLNEDDLPPKLSGTIEVDETYVGGRRVGGGAGRPRAGKKTIVAGALQRQGRVVAKVVEDVKIKTLIPFVKENVQTGSTVHTDEHSSYFYLRHYDYTHKSVPHYRKVWVIGDSHTNSIEGFWSLMKNGIRGVYKHVSPKYLQHYVDEYSFRYNRRQSTEPMFLSFLSQIRKIPY